MLQNSEQKETERVRDLGQNPISYSLSLLLSLIILSVF